LNRGYLDMSDALWWRARLMSISRMW